jgi:hypothetical protein
MRTETIFATWVSNQAEMTAAIRLEASLRKFGAEFAGSPFWVMTPQKAAFDPALKVSEGMILLAYPLPRSVMVNPFADKVYACAQAEALAEGKTKALVCIAPDTLITAPPRLYALPEELDLAYRPVHIRNVGLPVNSPLDSFWAGIYTQLGIVDIGDSVVSFIDKQILRFYFNSSAWSSRPESSILRAWKDHFTALMDKDDFQASACQDERHQIFLHQAVLSTLAALVIPPECRRLLPPTYNYPYNLQNTIPDESRVKLLNDLVSLVYEEETLHPDVVNNIAIEEPLRSFLKERF